MALWGKGGTSGEKKPTWLRNRDVQGSRSHRTTINDLQNCHAGSSNTAGLDGTPPGVGPNGWTSTLRTGKTNPSDGTPRVFDEILVAMSSQSIGGVNGKVTGGTGNLVSQFGAPVVTSVTWKNGAANGSLSQNRESGNTSGTPSSGVGNVTVLVAFDQPVVCTSSGAVAQVPYIEAANTTTAAAATRIRLSCFGVGNGTNVLEFTNSTATAVQGGQTGNGQLTILGTTMQQFARIVGLWNGTAQASGALAGVGSAGSGWTDFAGGANTANTLVYGRLYAL